MAEKKTATKTINKKNKTNLAPETEKKNSKGLRSEKKQNKQNNKGKAFKIKQLQQNESQTPPEEKKVPSFIILIFIFSMVFFLFALYKAFIYGSGYGENNPLPLEQQEQNEILAQTNGEESKISGETDQDQSEILLEDMKMIQDFYSLLTNNKIEEMNALVDRPLKNSVTWNNHWNKKNIKIFTNHLANTVLLQDLFMIPGSFNEEKKTRQYSYTLKYTILPEHQFEEEREVTLISRWEKSLISEIMCKTEGCSRSPFFWPQNYGLK